MIVPVMAISNLVLTRQIYSEETNGVHAHYREPVPLKGMWSKTYVTSAIPVEHYTMIFHVHVTCFTLLFTIVVKLSLSFLS